LIFTFIDSFFIYGLQCGTTALMVASYSGHHACARDLIMQGADINYQREAGVILSPCCNLIKYVFKYMKTNPSSSSGGFHCPVLRRPAGSRRRGEAAL